MRATGPTASTAQELARAVREREVSSVELVRAHLERLQELHRTTSCVQSVDPDAALAVPAERDKVLASGQSIGPLHGVPFTVKDWIDAEGMPCTGGYTDHIERRPARDATAVARLRAAGGVLLAKTAILGSELTPDVRNPHDPSRSPGGSSSGEAASVAGHASPLGLGSDSGGSVRLPAAWCGVAGLKPTFGRIPDTGHFPRVCGRGDGRTSIGPLARSVGDLRLALEILAGPDGIDPCVAPVPLRSPYDVGIEGLRVSWMEGEPGWEPEPAIRQAVEDAVRALQARGAILAGAPPPHLDECFDITTRYWTRRELSGAQVADQLEHWDRFRRRMLRFAGTVDALVLPATLERAPLMRPMRGEYYVFTLPASLTGAPAVTVPLGSTDGLPVAVQVVSRPWHDHVALAVAAAIESRAGLTRD